MNDPIGTEPEQVGGDVVDLDQVERELGAVEHALVRLDDGTYGTCHVCGEPLDDERLAADPTSLVCSAHLDVLRPA